MNGTATIAEPTVSAKWRALFALLPGYDPIATADPGQWFDEAEADKVIAFFHECLTHTKGKLAGKPLMLDAWEQAFVGCLFGWRNPDGTRRYREALLFIGRKNGKTTLMAGIVVYLLTVDPELGAEIYSAAAEREQAAIIFGIARQMVAQEPQLARRVQVFRGVKTLSCDERGASYKAISADAHTKHGFNSSCVIIDELHAQKDSELVDVLQTSTGSREQPLLLHTTTSDFDRPSICNEKHDYASKVRDGIIHDSSFLPVIFEAQRDDDWRLVETWRKANPGMGTSISETYLQRECDKAIESPRYENTFKRLHCNIRTEQDVVWLPMDAWDRCDGPVDPDALRGRLCYAGLDLSTKKDITAFHLVFPPNDDDDKWRFLPRFWVPGDNAHIRERRDRVPYLAWANEGFITLTPGNVVDYDSIRQQILDDGRDYDIRAIAADRWNLEALRQQVIAEGAPEIIEFGQGFASMSEPTKELEKLVLSGMIAHGGNPVLRWMAANVVVQTDAAGNIKANKERSRERIDGIVAAIMAIGAETLGRGLEPVGKFYEDNELEVG